MHFIVKKERRPMLKNFGKYKLAAVHTETVDQKQIEEEIQRNCSAKASDVRLVLTELAEVINQHLKAGQRVRLNDIGLLKLEIESEKHDTPEDFRIPQDIRNVRIHFLPEKYKGRKEMYDGIKFERLF